MRTKFFISFILSSVFALNLKAQDSITDSINVVKTMRELLTLCRTVDFSDPKVQSIGTFYKVAPYIVYRGEDKTRSWKDFANYENPEEKTGVDNVCLKINGSINQDTNYKIVRYITETESEGTWHILLVTYIKKGVEKKAAYAFLRINNRFGLGDID